MTTDDIRTHREFWKEEYTLYVAYMEEQYPESEIQPMTMTDWMAAQEKQRHQEEINRQN